MNQIKQQIQGLPDLKGFDPTFKEIIQESDIKNNPVLILYDLNLNLK
jgi:hypothetical protein